MLGLLSGAGLPVLFVGWAAGLPWWPFVLLAVLIAGTGLVEFLRRRRT